MVFTTFKGEKKWVQLQVVAADIDMKMTQILCAHRNEDKKRVQYCSNQNKCQDALAL